MRQTPARLCSARPLAYADLPWRPAARPSAAPCVFDGPINGESFRAYVEQQLVPVLIGSHKSAAIRQMIRSAGARLWYLPPYSPDLNPIEQAFAKVKHWMRAAQKRTIEDTWRHLGHLVDISATW